MKKLHPLLSVLFLISFGFSQHITHTETYESGNIKSITYHKKIRDSIVKVKVEGYYYTGQKKIETTFGKPDGLVTEWWENGQKKSEVTYKDEKRISSKEWNEDGSVKE